MDLNNLILFFLRVWQCLTSVMFWKKVKIPILWVLENTSGVCLSSSLKCKSHPPYSCNMLFEGNTQRRGGTPIHSSGGSRSWAKGGPGLDLLALLVFFPSVISSFLTQNRGGGGSPLDPPLHGIYNMCCGKGHGFEVGYQFSNVHVTNNYIHGVIRWQITCLDFVY